MTDTFSSVNLSFTHSVWKSESETTSGKKIEIWLKIVVATTITRMMLLMMTIMIIITTEKDEDEKKETRDDEIWASFPVSPTLALTSKAVYIHPCHVHHRLMRISGFFWCTTWMHGRYWLVETAYKAGVRGAVCQSLHLISMFVISITYRPVLWRT